MNPAKATAALESIDPKDLVPYREYFEKIKPRTEKDVFRRYLFAFSSIHVTWTSNVNLFSLLFDLTWIGNRESLRKLIHESRAGLVEGRTKSIWEFNLRYWKDPTWYLKREDEMWLQCRDRIRDSTFGIGTAKQSFALELIYPNEVELACGDVHQLYLYGLPGDKTPSQKTYGYIEHHWVSECKRLGFSGAGPRWLLWDRKKGQKDSRYWAYCLEGPKPDFVCPRQLELFSWAETSGIDTATVPA